MTFFDKIVSLFSKNTNETKPEIIDQSLLGVIQTVCQMPYSKEDTDIAGKYGLNICNVTWEDNSRSKNSCWGPCISDMTLNVHDNNLPIIRFPNFEDLTWDVEMDKIPLMVGNEHGENLRRTNLKEYLENFRDYLTAPSSWPGTNRSLYCAERDSHVIMSSQSCFLPIPPNGGESPFNVQIYNYQSYHGAPGVMAIVASSKGTSAQILQGAQKLYFNKNGEKCSFIGQRLSEFRREQGKEEKGPMTNEEKEQNMLLIIQVPLKQRKNVRLDTFDNYNILDQIECQSSMIKMESECMIEECKMRSVDVEHAIVKIGESEGTFDEIQNIDIERDPQYPVRVTLQYYKATSNGAIDNDVMNMVYQQLVESRKYGENIGSLVVGGNTNRPTETQQLKYGGYDLPIWWNDFWLTYCNVFSSYTESQARNKVFVNGRFCTATLGEVKEKILNILGTDDTKTSKTGSFTFN